MAKITREGIFLEELETEPSKYLPEIGDDELGGEARRLRERRVAGARGQRGANDGERAARLGARR